MRRALRPNQYDEYVIRRTHGHPRSTQQLRDYESRARADTSAVQAKWVDTDSCCELRSIR